MSKLGAITSIVVMVVCIGAAMPGHATEYWVSPSGSDVASGTEAAPFRTITRAMSAVKPGDTIFVKAGRYEECVAIGEAQSGEPGKWVTISAAKGHEREAVVGIERPRIDVGGRSASAFGLSHAHYVRLKGLACVSAYRSSGSGISASESDHLEIIDCVATGGGQGGLDLNRCDFITVDGVEAYLNGGGMGWSSGISIWLPQGLSNVVKNCVVYGNYDSSAYRTDGNGIIVDGPGPGEVGCLLMNNLAFMNGGQGICSTRTDNCAFLNNTSVENCWEAAQRESPNELNVRGANNLLRNNIAVSTFPNGVGLAVLESYGGGRDIALATIKCDHNLLYATTGPAAVITLGEQANRLTLEELRVKYPLWAGESLSTDPKFVDMANLDFHLRPDSPALRAGVALPEVQSDLTGRARPQTGSVSLGCYEGTYQGPAAPPVEPSVEIAPNQDAEAIRGLLSNEYDLDWHGMLSGWGKMLPEELPLQVDVRGPRRKDFLNLTGRFALGELLEMIAREHRVKLVVSQPEECRGMGSAPHAISRRLEIAAGAGAEERAFVRRALRAYVWTRSDPGISFASVLPALSAALGMKIESTPPIPVDREFVMVTRNMRLSAFLTDLADRMGVKLTLSRQDPLESEGAETVQPDTTFGGNSGVVSVKIGESVGRGSRIVLFARVRPEAALRARVGTGESFLQAPAGIDDPGPGPLNLSAYTRLVPGTTVRLAVVGEGCALNVSGEWLILTRLPADLTAGGFRVRSAPDAIPDGGMQFASMD
jgi:parallel beta-helix repeat protein